MTEKPIATQPSKKYLTRFVMKLGCIGKHWINDREKRAAGAWGKHSVTNDVEITLFGCKM